jgi:hypothetical protein
MTTWKIANTRPLKTHKVVIFLTAKEHETFKQECIKAQKPMSEIGRDLIRDFSA